MVFQVIMVRDLFSQFLVSRSPGHSVRHESVGLLNGHRNHLMRPTYRSVMLNGISTLFYYSSVIL